MTASHKSIILTSYFSAECVFTNNEGNTTPNPSEAILAITPKVVTLGATTGLNHTLANFEGELIIKIFPIEANSDPIKTGTKL